MKKQALLILIIGLLLTACKKNNTKTIKADLTFRSISFNSAYGGTDEKISEINEYFDSIRKLEKPRKSDLELSNYFQKLKDNDLFELPYIFLLLEKDSVITVHLTEKEYAKVKDIRHVDLYKKKKKMKLEIELTQLDSSIFYSENILKVEEVDGRSHSNK
ncbi:hypothetical protein HNV10_03915 [Winogradskyella litoriviva]|uniref:Lipoprotein n=1 Tax=Winogradskyella litoriviva TaxID=1220182 RepID=A0ABX2E2U5_9FLAO|nr:hypothetical protein [Winogradskyella litoriviva]NRD22373.1 hypothetical protein [Winogradskyella litoriviva]